MMDKMNTEAMKAYDAVIDKQKAEAAAKDEKKPKLSIDTLKERMDNLEFMFKIVALMCIVIGATLIFMLALLALAGAGI